MKNLKKNPVDFFGFIAALGYFALSAAYAVVLVLGLTGLNSQDDPIGDPFFTILEILILLMCPLIVAMFATIHLRALPHSKPFSLVALIFAAMLAGLTASIHFSILTISRKREIANLPNHDAIFAFEWPSLVYALDILAWDVFFAFAVLFAVPAIHGGRFARVVKALFLLSGILALLGLGGVILDDMQIRNIGILGYVAVFTVAALVLALHFRTTSAIE